MSCAWNYGMEVRPKFQVQSNRFRHLLKSIYCYLFCRFGYQREACFNCFVLELLKFSTGRTWLIFHVALSLSDTENSQLRKENPFPPIPPAVKVKDTEVITEEALRTTVRRALSYFSSIQAHDGHWPAENAGPLFFLQPFVCISTILQKCIIIPYFSFLHQCIRMYAQNAALLD